MAEFFMENHKGLYSDDPEDKMNKGEIAGRCRNMFDRYDTGVNADANGDQILVGGILPPNLTVIDAWIKVDAVLDAGVTLTLLSKTTRTEAENEANPGVDLVEGAATTLIPATVMDVNTFVRMGDNLVAPPIAGERLGTPSNGPGEAGRGVGTQFMVEIGAADITVLTKISVFIMYASD